MSASINIKSKLPSIESITSIAFPICSFIFSSRLNFAIVSSSYFLDETIVNLTLTLENDLDVIVTFPEEFIDGNAHGFSQSEYFTVTYKDIILSKATGYSGTMTALYKDNGEFHIEFTNYDDCEFYYTGMFE